VKRWNKSGKKERKEKKKKKKKKKRREKRRRTYVLGKENRDDKVFQNTK